MSGSSDWTSTGGGRSLYVNAEAVDGEIVELDETGRPQFYDLTSSAAVSNAPAPVGTKDFCGQRRIADRASTMSFLSTDSQHVFHTTARY